jgi:aminopeptidase N
MIDRRLQSRYGLKALDVLRAWWLAHRGQPVTTADFRAFLIDQTSDPKYWTQFFADWVESTPCPTLTVKGYTRDETHATVWLERTGGAQTMDDLPIQFDTPYGATTVTVDVIPGAHVYEVHAEVPAGTEYLRIDPDGDYIFRLDSSIKQPYPQVVSLPKPP